jgi:hypothetical protein
MLEWAVVKAEHRQILPTAMQKAWRGGEGVVADVGFETKPGYPPRFVTFAWGEGTSARRAAAWPDLLTDWTDIYDEKLFPSDVIPVLAEEASALGASVLIAQADHGLGRASQGWYAKGALVEYEHVGSASVAWMPGTGLGRPFDGSTAQLAGQAGKRVAKFLGDKGTSDVLSRMEGANVAIGAAILEHAFFRVLDQDPPTMDILAGMVSQGQVTRIRLT